MFKSLRVPERLFQIAAWIVSIVFAGFLIGLGGKIVGELPGVDQYVSIQQYMDPARTARIAVVRDSLIRLERDLSAAQERARLNLTAASNAYRARRESFDNWIATRVATTDPRQDPEVLRRTAELDQLKAGERSAQTETERLDADLLRVTQALDAQRQAESLLEEGASSRYQRAKFQQELRVFAIRLVITLPLLLVAAWLMVRQRRSQYWPLFRGFVLFALFAFFVELVPYLPRLRRIALQFPKWTDGRAYSQARLLRVRHRYAGELRATGDVIPDMAAQLHRTGFDAAVLRAGESVDVARRMLALIPAFYQGDAIEPRLRFARGSENAGRP